MDDSQSPKEEGTIESPYVPESFDYNKYQTETTGKAMLEIYKVLGENAASLSYTNDSTTESINEGMHIVADKIRDILVDCKVPNGDMQKLMDTMQSTMGIVFNIIIKQKDNFEKELLARVIDSRDPGFPEKCSPEYVTLGDLFMAVKKLQDSQGVDHFYHIKKVDGDQLPK